MKNTAFRHCSMMIVFLGLARVGVGNPEPLSQPTLPRISVIWKNSMGSQDFIDFRLHDFSVNQRVSITERAPESGKLVRWTGVRLSALVDKINEKLGPDQSALIDLVTVRNSTGKEATIPRYLISKYPLLIATERDGRAVEAFSGIVVPWTSYPRILKEDLPVRSYFLQGVKELELGSYQQKYASLLLRRRTDPTAIRGERFFLQACVGCHQNVVLSPSNAHASDAWRDEVRITDRNRRALSVYLEAYRKQMNSPRDAGQ